MNWSRERDLGASRGENGAWCGVNVTLGHWAAAIPALWEKLLLPPTPRGSSLLLCAV